jgi:LCP family protein required for cell wall assembly
MKQPSSPRSQKVHTPSVSPNRAYTSYQPQHKTTTQSAPKPQSPKSTKRRFPVKRTLAGILVLILVPLLIFSAITYQNVSAATEKLFGSSNLFSLLPPNSLLKDTNGNTNILLVGYSADDPGHGGALLTDSIMVMSVKQDQKTGFMLSVPRDLYVRIPDYGSAKINEAFQAGERQGFNEPGYPANGMGLLQKVVSDNFGIDIHYNMLINYAAVREVTDSLGGIIVTIESPDPRGIYDPNFKPEEGGPLRLSNGEHTIDGQTALRLTRARGSTFGSYGFPQSDFNRTQNQQRVVNAIKQKLTIEALLRPSTNGKILNAAAENVKTSVDINAALPLFMTVRSTTDSSLKQVNLRDFNGKNLLASYLTPSGQSALIPAAGVNDFSDIQAAVDSL